MSDKNKDKDKDLNKGSKKDEELWAKQFADDDYEAEDGVPSRIVRKNSKTGISPLLKTSIVILLLMIIIPTLTYLWWNNNQSKQMAQDNNQALIEIQAEDESTETSEESESSEESEESETETTESTQAETETSQAPEPETVEETTPPETTADPSQEYSTYTVQPGDNLYRIALNHGMSLEELKSLNGLSSDTVAVGTVLRVR